MNVPRDAQAAIRLIQTAAGLMQQPGTLFRDQVVHRPPGRVVRGGSLHEVPLQGMPARSVQPGVSGHPQRPGFRPDEPNLTRVFPQSDVYLLCHVFRITPVS